MVEPFTGLAELPWKSQPIPLRDKSAKNYNQTGSRLWLKPKE